jgi:hypothetical protein
MFADRYTKVVLTIIAFTLVIIAAENAIQPSRAYGDIQVVEICDALHHCAGMTEMSTQMGGAYYVLDVKTH